ncbi:DUF2339 domain-containing protein [Chromobacterium phragmitis]|uniref:DUF2339 domain-containing protein n=2 Tax=Chromobacterium phragmitis TaxID=2202141 RepID=UPI000DEC5BAD|nr:DUF2339 domain-containing protein [Chromobacterium phragmitis]AXE29404.1 DUF2339 domain-containing protein [Chromobacterium phragmitis]
MRHWILALLGLLLGIAIDGFSLGLSLAVLGGVVSLALGKSGGATGKDGSPPSQHASRSMTLWQLQQRLEALEIEVQLLREQARSQAGAAPAPEAAWQAEPPSPPPSEPAPATPPPQEASPPEPQVSIEWEATPPRPEPERLPAAETPQAPAMPRIAAPTEPTLLDRGWRYARDWLLGGNAVVRVGMLLLFFGFAFLLKYAADNSLLPIELRLAGVALGGCALLAAGWKLRLKRRGYALILQGGGVGTLYITAFVTLKFFQLLPPGLTLAFLILLGVASALLAVRQDAPSLAGMGITGGFLAPILTATGGGSHIVLFGYYALLNAGIFGIAWRKSWRSLNLLGFAFTFVIATAWGALQYRPELLATTLPFLALFFAFYLGISLLYALRQRLALRHYVDGTLVFGTPLAASGLAAGLLRHAPLGMAWCAVALASVYLLLTIWLRRRHRAALPLLADAFLALGVIFATLAVPLAFDGRTTTALWAVEGAGLLWISLRQQRLLGRWFALGLQLCAGIACLANLEHAAGALPALNSAFIACLLLALSGLFSGWQLHRRAESDEALPALLAIWGGLWWLGGGVRELGLFLPDRDFIDGVMLFLSLSLALCGLLRRKLDWKLLAYPALSLPALTMGWSLLGWLLHAHPLSGLGAVAVPASLAISLWLLRRHEEDADNASWLHACWLWAFAALLTREAGWWLWQWLPAGVWRATALPAAASALLLLLSGPLQKLEWPIRRHAAAYLGYGPAPLFPALAGWMLWSLLSDGNPSPLPWLPLLNPLDLAIGFSLLALCAWLRRLNRPTTTAAWLLCPAILLAVSADVLRAFHHWGGMPYSLKVLWSDADSRVVLALCWCALALAAPLLAARREGSRVVSVWSAAVGATLLLWMLLANLEAGAPLLLPWLPLLNPLELAQLAVLACVGINWRRAGFPRPASWPWLDYAIAAWLIGFGCAIVMRAFHHWQGMAYRLDAVLASPLPLATLMLCWALLALIAPRLAANRPGASRVVACLLRAISPVLLLWSVLANLEGARLLPLPHIPLLNPLELAQLAVFAACWRNWKRGPLRFAPLAPWLRWLAGGWLFLFGNAVALRSLHHWLDIPYRFDALLHSTLAQATLSLGWTLAALGLMVAATRRGLRLPWLCGGALLALVVAKLFLVDLASVGSIARIISFIGVGLLFLLIGYLSPLPPRAPEPEKEPA